MKNLVYRSFMIFGLVLCSTYLLAQNSKFYDYDGKFKISFPSTPTSQSNVQETDMGNVTVYMFISEDQGGAYLVSYVDYPANKMDNLDKKELLNKAKNGFVQALNLTTTDSMFMNYAKHPGILFHANDGKTFVSIRDYLVENRLYQLGMLKYEAITDQEENDFFDSFELVK